MTKEEAIEQVKKNGYFLSDVSDEFKNDKEIVLAAVSNKGWTLKYASNELKNNKEIVLAAVSNNGYSLKYASDELKNDKEFVLAAVSNDGWSLQYASNELKNNKEIVLAAESNMRIIPSRIVQAGKALKTMAYVISFSLIITIIIGIMISNAEKMADIQFFYFLLYATIFISNIIILFKLYSAGDDLENIGQQK